VPLRRALLFFRWSAVATPARRRRVAFLASRTNTMLSISMLYFMGAGVHGL